MQKSLFGRLQQWIHISSAYVGSENYWNYKFKICYFVVILRSYVDELKWRINSEWTTLSQAVMERAVGEWRQRL